MEDIFDKDITIINRYIDKEHKTQYKISYLKGFWNSNSGISINGTHLIKDNEVSAKILIYDSRNPKFQKKEEFKKEQKMWTLQKDDYVIKGIVTEFTTITKLLENYEDEDKIKIKKIAVKDYGSKEMQHFTITGG